MNLPVMQYCQKMYFPCTFLTVDLCKRSESIVKSVRPCTLLTANFGKTKISLLHGMGLSRKFCFITDCTALTSRNSLFFFFLIISADKLEGYPPYAASFSCSLRIRFLMLYPINNRAISTPPFSLPRT